MPALQAAHLVAGAEPRAAALTTARPDRMPCREKSPERIGTATLLSFYRADNTAPKEEKVRNMTTFLIGSAVVFLALFVIGLYSGVTLLHELE